MAVGSPRYQDALKISCSRHRRYRSKAEAAHALSWHLTCAKCKESGRMSVFACTAGPFWHIGHAWAGESGVPRCAS